MKEGIYEQLINEKIRSNLESLSEELYLLNTENLDEEEAKVYLSAYISEVTRRALTLIREDEKSTDEALIKQIQVCNEIIQILSERLQDHELKEWELEENGELLTAVYKKLNNNFDISNRKVARPITSISQSTLFTGSHHEPSMVEELKREIVSSDEIDWLVSFIKWSGLRILMGELKEFTERGGVLRIITTSYMEATDYKAIEELSKLPNTEIKVSLDKKRTRLHAKAYLFNRETGFSTAYIGSSNLSNPALTAGLEWNMKVSEKDSFDILRKFDATFESYWNDEEFVLLQKDDPTNWSLLEKSLQREVINESSASYYLDVHPYHYQREILDELEVERKIHNRWKNLVVAATGVGKTVISAFDFKRYLSKNPTAKLLFVAHREEILRQSLVTFRMILKDPNFGELFVGQHKPNNFKHLFVSIQSWNSRALNEVITKDFYDFIIVDEFHHAAAPSYQELLSYYEPKILLGLTATPERMDSKNILSYFDDRIASEMRLKEAIDRKLLSPFHYFCVTDDVDLKQITWSRKGYNIEELSNLYTANDRRSDLIIRSLKKYVTSLVDVKGIGFCVSVEHAKYMAAYFNHKGIKSVALHGNSEKEQRGNVKRQLTIGELKFIFVVDLYNEGVDIPEVNTILFLRPTESMTVFLQQLGRGLRLAENKECLTVLDFIGRAHKEYSFEDKFRALVGHSKHSIRHYVDKGFTFLPRGSVIQMEKVAKEYILNNLKGIKNTEQSLISRMKHFEADTGNKLTLKSFINYYHLTLADVYGRGKKRTFTRLKEKAGIIPMFHSEQEERIQKQIHKLFYLDAADLLNFYLAFLDGKQSDSELEQQKIAMLYYSFYVKEPLKEGFNSMKEAVRSLLSEEWVRQEIKEVLEVCLENIHTIGKESPFTYPLALHVHAHYTTDQVMAAFGYYNDAKKPAFREGVKHFKEKNTDIFFITLNKSEKDFSLSTQYDDYAINEELFHWQSQGKVSNTSPTAQRYIHHKENQQSIALFIREYKTKDGFTSPFIFLGLADYVQHSGSNPVSFVWKLHEPLPAYLLPEANKNVL